MATTKLTNLLNPQVVGEYIDAKLVDKIKLSPLAIVGTELQGRPGNTLTVPTWQYVGEAIDLAEGVADVQLKSLMKQFYQDTEIQLVKSLTNYYYLSLIK